MVGESRFSIDTIDEKSFFIELVLSGVREMQNVLGTLPHSIMDIFRHWIRFVPDDVLSPYIPGIDEFKCNSIWYST